MSSAESICISCGMPLRTADDHCLSDPAKPFCRHCGTAAGELKSRSEVLDGLITFLTRTQDIDPQVARAAASEMMSKLPAWRTR